MLQCAREGCRGVLRRSVHRGVPNQAFFTLLDLPELTPRLFSDCCFYLTGPHSRRIHLEIGFHACILVNNHLVTACFYFPRQSWRMSMTNYTTKVVVAPCVFTSPLLKRASFRRQTFMNGSPDYVIAVSQTM
jgi:hypothetical protein